MQQQHLDERAGATGVTVGFAGRGPKRVVLGGERLGGAGLLTLRAHLVLLLCRICCPSESPFELLVGKPPVRG